MQPDLHEKNRLSWNVATAAHNRHKGDQAAFFRNGGSTLFPEERDLLGDVRGRRLAHLLCNSGQDSLSLAALGAAVIGIDISDEAIAAARQLSLDSGIPAHFERSDIYPWFDQAAGQQRFDDAFCSYGALCWLSDIERFASGVTTLLKPGGRFVCLEFHPTLLLIDDDWSVRRGGLAPGGMLCWPEGIGDYVGESGDGLTLDGHSASADGFHNPHPAYEFHWSLAQIVEALLKAGLTLERLEEYPFLNGWKALPDMVPAPGRRWLPPPERARLPLMFGLVARRP